MTGKQIIKYIYIMIFILVVVSGLIIWKYFWASRAFLINTPAESNEIILTSCGTEDLGVVLSRVRTAVVYIHGKRVRLKPEINDPIQFAPSALTADKMGSGIIFDPRGYIITNYHVIENITDIRVRLFNEPDTEYSCDIIEIAPDKDLAVIQIHTGYMLQAAKIGNSDMHEVADEVLAVGCPFSLEQSVSYGIISDLKRTVTIEGRQYIDLIQTDAVINSGNSGGALVNMDGDVIGINVAIYAPTRVYCGVGFAIPINQAKLLIMKIQYRENSVTDKAMSM
nr:magnetosome protein MamO-greigite [Desulfobacteraceae bacterium]